MPAGVLWGYADRVADAESDVHAVVSGPDCADGWVGQVRERSGVEEAVWFATVQLRADGEQCVEPGVDTDWVLADLDWGQDTRYQERIRTRTHGRYGVECALWDS